jgi:hypothetical protein
VRDDVTISYRGARYEIGQGQRFYGIWPTGAGKSAPPLEWWHGTPEGWYGAWSRFTRIEAPATITPVTPAGRSAPSPSSVRIRALAGTVLLGAGVALGIAGLFPSYFAGQSLAQQPVELVPHAVYLAVWITSVVLILLGGRRRHAGALLGLGTSIVTFGFFLADAGTAVVSGSSAIGAGLALGLVGWLACAAGSATAFSVEPAGPLGRPVSTARGAVLTLTVAALAALGAAVTFALAWDSYTLRTAAGVTQTITEGNAFGYPALVIAGNVAVMIALVAVVVTAAVWRPVRVGAALLAGALIPMVAQAISAMIQIGQPATPAQFNISPPEAAQLGLTISSGLTAAFWAYCAFLVVLAALGTWMLISGRVRRLAGAQQAAAPAAAPWGAGTLSSPQPYSPSPQHQFPDAMSADRPATSS